MSESNEAMDTENTNEANQAQAEARLYAGKYKTVEDLEKGYKEGHGVHVKNKELNEKLEEVTRIPEHYAVPEGINLRELELNEMKNMAREAGLNQSQFDQAIKRQDKNVHDKMQSLEQRVKSIDEKERNLIKGHLDKNFKSLDEGTRNDFFNRIIQDDSAMSGVLKDREASLNSSVPGMNQISAKGESFDMQKELQKASMEASANPSDMTKRARYIELCNQSATSNK